jgi:hypothetical protein
MGNNSDPENPISRIKPNNSSLNGVIAVIENCEFCGGTHQHGIPDFKDQETAEFKSHRGSHCTGQETDGYYITVTENTDISL